MSDDLAAEVTQDDGADRLELDAVAGYLSECEVRIGAHRGAMVGPDGERVPVCWAVAEVMVPGVGRFGCDLDAAGLRALARAAMLAASWLDAHPPRPGLSAGPSRGGRG